MDSHSKKIQISWDKRQEVLGNNIQSVLYKNLPAFINNYIHNSHIKFILNNIPRDCKAVLDVGCGYGRISTEIKKRKSNVDIEGIEICKAYAEHFNSEIGACFHGTAQEYIPKRKFDAIIVVTILMYAQPDELQALLEKLWGSINPGGRLICIEQNINILIRARMLLGGRLFQPTGKDVIYFSKNKLYSILSSLFDAKISDSRSFGMFPILNFPIMHNGFVVDKK